MGFALRVMPGICMVLTFVFSKYIMLCRPYIISRVLTRMILGVYMGMLITLRLVGPILGLGRPMVA